MTRPPQIVAKAGLGRDIDNLVMDMNRALQRVAQSSSTSSNVKAERIKLLYDGASSNIDGSFTAIPASSQILAFTIDNVVPWSTGSTAVLTIGITAGGTQYMSAVDVMIITGKIHPVHTNTQMDAMDDIGTNTTVVCRVALSGVHVSGETRITMWYL